MSGNPFRRTPGTCLDDETSLNTAYSDASLSLSATRSRQDSPERLPPQVPLNGVDPRVRAAFDRSLWSHAPDATTPRPKAPINPFARTLATTEAEVGLQPAERHERGHEDEQDFQQRAGRQTLHVDAFKNILLTGSAHDPASFGSNPARPPFRPPDSSSGTETSSLSRHSMFDTSHDLHPESPRTSFDDYHSPSEQDELEAAEDSSLMGIDRADDIAPPAPPKPKQKGPQTVSFADFDEAIPTDFHAYKPATPPINTQLTSILRPSLARSPSDLNKPLPPPPQQPVPSVLREDVSAAISGQGQNSLHETPSKSHEVSEAKRPPPPPASRRQVANFDRPSSLSGASLSSQRDQTPRSSFDDKDRNDAPVPPPSRKAGSAQRPSEPAPVDEALLPRNSDSPSSLKPMPPPPPRRHSSKSGNISRTASTASRRSDGAAASTTTDAGTENTCQALAPPPPPPPRRGAGGGSSRSSTDGPPSSLATRRLSGNELPRRFSAQSFGSDRSVSISSLAQVSEPGEDADSTAAAAAAVSPSAADPRRGDVLADMSAFQAEVDSLRAAFGTR